jgi:glycosyltransferase involved in cell wall biosynthesis
MAIISKKTLYICPNGYLGGAERFICNVAQGHLNNKNMDFEILFFSEGDAYDLCKSIGATVHLLPMQFKLSKLVQLLKVLIWIRQLIRRKKYSVIHSTMPYAHIVATLSSFGMPLRRIWFQHGPVGGVLDKIANVLPVDSILFNSRYLEEEHLKMNFSSRRRNKHSFINLGTATEQRKETSNVKSLRTKYMKRESDLLLLSAGRICSWKGQDNVIKSIHQLKESSPTCYDKVTLLIVGDVGRQEDNIFKKELLSLVKQLNLQSKVIFIGHVNNITEYYAAADVFIHSSTIPEPFGLTVLEAMATKTIIIGSDKGGIKNILSDGSTGFTFDSTSQNAPTHLAKKLKFVLEKLINDKDELSLIIDNAYQLTKTTHSLRNMVAEVESITKQLVEN